VSERRACRVVGDADFDPQKSEPKGAANGTTNADAGVGERAHTLWLPLSFAKIVTARNLNVLHYRRHGFLHNTGLGLLVS